RLEVMCVLSGFDMPVHSIRYYTSSAINIVIQVARLSDGSRKVVSVTEITGMEGSTITMEEIFKFSVLEGSTTGRVRGMLKATGIRPRFIERIRGLGVEVSDEIFKICSIG
ncbi:MAG TPA: CpaF family protein, partial [Candidatus Hypogeohydataceae bacterium YC40]